MTEKSRNYTDYQLSKKEWLLFIAAFAMLDGAAGWMFYRSWTACILFLPAGVPALRICRRNLAERSRRQLEKEFLMGMQAVSTALSAGYSMENAVEEALKELKRHQEQHTFAIREFAWIVGGLRMNRTLEELFLELAGRSGSEDIESFAQVFSAARKSGGDLIAIIRNTVQAVYQKEETRQEIMVCLAARKMEQGVMSLVPFFILAYVRLASPGFLDTLYHNPFGVFVMTLCLAVYICSWYMGRKIVEIEV